MRCVIVLAFVLTASLNPAGEPAMQAADDSGILPAWNPGRDATLIFSQPPGVRNHVSSQDFCDVGALTEGADDFPYNDSQPIGAVEWWGGYWNCDDPPILADCFVIRFYSDADGGSVSLPGELLYEEQCYAYTETYLWGGPSPTAYFYNYYCELTPQFAPLPGATYWLSIQAVYPFYDGGQWGRRRSRTHWGDFMAFKSLYFCGDEEWHESFEAFGDGYDLAFGLYAGEQACPVEETTWTSIKAMYR